jgi:protein-disulfide isomerase
MTAAKARSGKATAREIAAQRMAQQRSAERRRKAIFASILAVAIVVAAGIIGAAVYTSQKNATTIAIPKGGTATGITVGQSSAKSTIDIYLDYQCPICQQFEQMVGDTLKKASDDGQAKVVYHPVAYLDDRSTTRYSSRASAATACAADAGIFPAFNQIVFANQPPEGGNGLPDDQLISFGKQAGAKGDAFEQCVKDKKFQGWVSNVTDAASRKGVQGTPTVFVNGKQLRNPTPQAITDALKAA